MKIRYLRQNGKVQTLENLEDQQGRTHLERLRLDPDCCAAILSDGNGNFVDGYNMPFYIGEDNPVLESFEHLRNSLIERIMALDQPGDLQALHLLLNERQGQPF